MSTPREVAAAIAVGAIFLAALWVVTGVAILTARTIEHRRQQARRRQS